MDESSAKKHKNRTRNLAIDLATFFVIAVVAVGAFVVIGQKDATTTTADTTVNITGLHCEKPTTENTYFTKPTPESGTAEVSANFDGDNLTDLMFTYTGVYPAGTDLDKAKTSVHAAFDLDLGNKYVHADGVWSETFSILDSRSAIKMTVYSSAGHLRSSAAPVFDLPKSSAFPKSLVDVKSAYEERGYTCEVKK